MLAKLGPAAHPCKSKTRMAIPGLSISLFQALTPRSFAVVMIISAVAMVKLVAHINIIESAHFWTVASVVVRSKWWVVKICSVLRMFCSR